MDSFSKKNEEERTSLPKYGREAATTHIGRSGAWSQSTLLDIEEERIIFQKRRRWGGCGGVYGSSIYHSTNVLICQMFYEK